MRLIKRFLQDNWRAFALYAGLFAALGSLLYWRLGSLLPGYSGHEVAIHREALSLTGLFDDPFNAPFLIAIKVLSLLHIQSPLAGRVVAVGGGLLILGLFCLIVRMWHGARTAIIGTLLLGTSAWFLHAARMGTPEIMFFGVFALFGAGYWFKQSQGWPALLACFIVGASFLYTPGMIWFILVGLVWQWRTIDTIFKKYLLAVSLGTLLLLISLVPLGWALYKHTSLIMPWLGLPGSWPMPWDIVKNILLVPYHLAVSNQANPEAWLGTAAVLDVFSVALFIIGGWVYLQRFRLLRTPIIISILSVGLVLIGLGQGSISLILPFVYLVIAAGAGHLLSQWLSVFPRNPIARGLGMVLMCLVIALSVSYHLRHYFIGWPQARATHNVYHIQLPKE